MAADRKSQVGTGDRSERIRTYNYPQGRVTDHRINLTLYKLDAILNGDLDEIIQALNAADQAAKCRRPIQMHKEIWTIGRILQWTEQYFQSKEMDTPRLDGEVLLSRFR